MVITLVDSLRDGMNVGRGSGGCNRGGDKEDNKVAQYGIQVHKCSFSRRLYVRGRHRRVLEDVRPPERVWLADPCYDPSPCASTSS